MTAEHPEYPKINSLWKRDEKGRCLVGEWANDTLAALNPVQFLWTEKVDGTNVRLGYRPAVSSAWDGDLPKGLFIGGRTDNAQFPGDLYETLYALQRSLPYEDVFPDVTEPVTLYGEGYGPGIQKGGGLYRPDKGFVLFDVKVGPHWLSYENVCDVGQKLGLDVVPLRFTAPLLIAWRMVGTERFPSSSKQWPNSQVEGLVGRPPVTLYDGRGHRILAKVKVRDHK
jgi:hypothetical protein